MAAAAPAAHRAATVDVGWTEEETERLFQAVRRYGAAHLKRDRDALRAVVRHVDTRSVVEVQLRLQAYERAAAEAGPLSHNALVPARTTSKARLMKEWQKAVRRCRIEAAREKARVRREVHSWTVEDRLRVRVFRRDRMRFMSRHVYMHASDAGIIATSFLVLQDALRAFLWPIVRDALAIAQERLDYSGEVKSVLKADIDAALQTRQLHAQHLQPRRTLLQRIMHNDKDWKSHARSLLTRPRREEAEYLDDQDDPSADSAFTSSDNDDDSDSDSDDDARNDELEASRDIRLRDQPSPLAADATVLQGATALQDLWTWRTDQPPRASSPSNADTQATLDDDWMPPSLPSTPSLSEDDAHDDRQNAETQSLDDEQQLIDRANAETQSQPLP